MRRRLKRIWSISDPLITKMYHDNIFAIAGQSAFFLILSVFPLSMFVVSILQNFHIPIEQLNRVLGIVLNESATKYVSDYLTNVYKNATSISFLTLLFTLWSAAQGIHAITNGLNRIHNTYENRNWLFLRLRAMLYTVIFFAILLASMAVIVLGGELNKLLEPYLTYLPDFIAFLYSVRYVIIFVYVVFLFTLIYRNFPNLSREVRRDYGFRNQLPGAILCAASWFVLSFGISVYVGDFNGFSIYGSLMKLAIIMVWLYFCIAALMIGAEFNCVYHEQIKGFRFKNIVRHFKNRKKK